MTSNIEKVQAIYAAYGRRDVQAILDLCDEDVTWGIDSIAAGEVAPYGVLRGKAGVGRFFSAWAETADFQTFAADDYVGAGDHVFNHLRYELVVKATGRRVKQLSMQHWTFRDGRLLRWRGYEDTALTRDAFR